MPPAYKPLPTSIQGIPAEIFAAPEETSFDDQQKINAALRAQQLNNQSSEISVAQRQRDNDYELQLRDALVAQYGGENAGSEFNPDEALQTAQRLALQGGNLDTALNIERITRERMNGSAPLTPQQRALFEPETGPLPDGVTMKDLTALSALQRTNIYGDQVHDPRLARNRELNAVLAEQRATGTQIRPVPYAAAQKIGAGDAFVAQMDDMEQRYIPLISENRGVRFLEAAVNPNSPEARLYGELNLAAKQAALSLEDRVTDQDFKTIQEISTPNALDTNETVIDRMRRLKEFIQRRNQADLNAMDAGRFNVSGLQNRGGFIRIPRAGAQNQGQPLPSLTPDAGSTTDDETAYKEAYKARMRAQRGM